MHSGALLSTADVEAYSKCAQFYTLLHCVSTKDCKIKQARRIIRKKGNVNYQIPSSCVIGYNKDIRGSTLLHIACYHNEKCELVEDLLNLGADFTIKNQCGDTALHRASKTCSFNSNEFSKYQDCSHIDLILSAHIKLANSHNPSDNHGLSHLHIACMANHVKAVEFFLENGVDINHVVDKQAKQYSGYTPLHSSVKYCSVETAEVLLKYGADKSIKNKFKMTPLWQLLSQRLDLLGSTAMLTRSETMRKTLDEQIEKTEKIILMFLGNNFLQVDIVDDVGLSSFHIACVLQDLSKVESLLEQVADMNHCISMDSQILPGYTALHFAAHSNNIITMKLLHEKGANIDVKTAKGLTPIDICIRNGHIEDIRAAISLKPEWAIGHVKKVSDTRIVDLLLDHGADVNLEDTNGYSALHKALDAGSLRLHLMEKLLSLGANINSEDIYGVTPFESLLHSDDVSAEDVRFFLKHGCRANASNPSDDEGYLGIVFAKENKTYRDLLYGELMKAPDVGAVNELGRTLIHNAVAVREAATPSDEYVDFFNRFKEFGYDVDDQDHPTLKES